MILVVAVEVTMVDTFFSPSDDSLQMKSQHCKCNAAAALYRTVVKSSISPTYSPYAGNVGFEVEADAADGKSGRDCCPLPV